MNFSTVPSVEVELLGKVRHLRLTLSAPGWYREITRKPLNDLITVLQHQFQAGLAVRRVNEAHALALGVPVEELPANEVVDPDSILDPKDNIAIEDMVEDVTAAIYALAHWEDVVARPQGHKDIAQPGELFYLDLGAQLDLDAYPGLMVALVEVYGRHAMKAGKDTEVVDPNAKSPTPPNSGDSGGSSLTLPPTNS
jgi:hypothetical protein